MTSHDFTCLYITLAMNPCFFFFSVFLHVPQLIPAVEQEIKQTKKLPIQTGCYCKAPLLLLTVKVSFLHFAKYRAGSQFVPRCS